MIKMKLVYISYPYSDNPEKRRDELFDLLPKISKEDIVPLVPHFAFWKFQEMFGRDYAMKVCVEAVGKCDEMWVVGNKISPGMQMEMDYAKQNNITIVNKEVI